MEQETKTFFTPYHILMGSILVISLGALVYSILKVKKRYLDWPSYSLSKLQLPSLQSPESENVTAASSEAPITIFRPFNQSLPSDYYGVFKVDRTNSATLIVSNSAGYHEVVVYKYPSWEIAYAETNISEVPMDFLESGNYVVAVFSPSKEIEGALNLTKNTMRPEPKSKIHRVTSTQVAENRDIAVAASVNALNPTGTREILRMHASDLPIWPKPVYTRVQTLTTTIPPSASAIFVAVPSYGYILEGADEHLGQIVHEGNNAAIYRAATQTSGSLFGTGDRFIYITVLYPDISPTSPTLTSPTTTAFVFAPRVEI